MVPQGISRFQTANSNGVVEAVLPSEEVLQAEARLTSRRHSTGGPADTVVPGSRVRARDEVPACR